VVVSAESEGDRVNSRSVWETDSFLCCLQHKVKQEEQIQAKCVSRLRELFIKERTGRLSSHHLCQNRSILYAAVSGLQPDRFVSFQQGQRLFPNVMLLPSNRLEVKIAIKKAVNKVESQAGRLLRQAEKALMIGAQAVARLLF
jgi:hypothetical protein